MSSGKVFKILAIDGGGIRGVYPAHILKRIKEEFQIDFRECFDLIAGTSTGSIIAAALAVDHPINAVVDLYEKNGSQIFASNGWSLGGLTKSKYTKQELEKLLKDVFGDKTLAEAKPRLLIPATDISNGTVHVFKSPYLTQFVRDQNVRITDAVLASCSAPTYFDPQKVGPYLLSDGGLWANNPGFIGVVEAMSKLGKTPADIRLLSLGTGIGDKYYDVDGAENRSWGLARAWGSSKLIDTILNLQSTLAHNMSTLLLPTDNYLRINFNSDTDLSLDDHVLIPTLKAKADLAFTHNSEKIRGLLQN